MEINELLSSLYKKMRLGIKPGLDRTYNLAEYLQNPQNKFKSVHIAGTNGKGATASYVASMLQESGFKVGLYTSPHFFEFNERIRINGKKIHNDEVIINYNKIKEISNELGATFFEITTIIAFEYFAENKVDFAVIETGMGGRYDSTNIIMPEISLITSIGMDHSEFLGDTLEKIAFEKAGIIKKNTPVFISKFIPENAKNVIKGIANQQNSILEEITDNFGQSKTDFDKNLVTKVILDEYELELKNPGRNQLNNFSLAFAAIKYLFEPKINNIQKSLLNLKNNTGYLGRLEKIPRKPDIIIDISHNEEAIDNILKTFSLHNYNEKINILFTCMKDKKYDKILSKLSKISKNITLTDSNSSRNIEIDKLEKFCKENKINYRLEPGPTLALKKLKEEKEPILITGSFFLIDALKNELEF